MCSSDTLDIQTVLSTVKYSGTMKKKPGELTCAASISDDTVWEKVCFSARETPVCILYKLASPPLPPPPIKGAY